MLKTLISCEINREFINSFALAKSITAFEKAKGNLSLGTNIELGKCDMEKMNGKHASWRLYTRPPLKRRVFHKINLILISFVQVAGGGCFCAAGDHGMIEGAT